MGTRYTLVTEYFHPDTATTGQLMTDLAVGLEERGVDIEVYTGQPNYHSGENERQPTVSTHEGVPVRRIRAPQVRQTSLPRRVFNWVVFTAWMFLRLLFERPGTDRELIFVSNPPFLPTAMWLVSRLRGWDYTYIVHDMQPDQPVELGYLDADGLPARLWDRAHRAVFHDAETVVALGPAMKERIAGRCGPEFDESKVAVIHNWEDEDAVRPRAKSDNWFSEEHDLVDPFTVLYSGNIGEFHDLETLVRAADRLRDENVRVMIIGEGDNKSTVQSLADDLDLTDETVTFLPYQPWDDLPYSLTSGDVSVVSMKEGFAGVCVSSKLYTALAAGMPVLCIAEEHDDESRVVRQFDAGIQVSPGDVDGLVEAIETWMDDPELVSRQGANAREALEDNFTLDQSIDQYYEAIVDD